MAMVHRQNKKDPGIGGHISTYSSLATPAGSWLQSFLSAPPTATSLATSFYFQGHASPGVYAPPRFLEGRISEEHLEGFPSRVARRSIVCLRIRTPG